MDVDQAHETQLRNIESATQASREQWFARIAERRDAGLKHGQIVQWLKAEFGLTYGNANALVHAEAKQGAPDVDLVQDQYAGGKARLKPIYDRLVAEADALGDDVKVAPKKASVSLRRSRQFAVITPASTQRIDLGLNLRGEESAGRLETATGMCTHRVRITSMEDIDEDVVGWLRAAYERA